MNMANISEDLAKAALTDTASLRRLLEHVTGLFERQSDQVLLEQFGIGVAQIRVLHIVAERPGIKQSAIARSLGQTEASISRQIKLLQEKDLLESRPSSTSGRERTISLLPLGDSMVEAANEALRSYHDRTLTLLTDKQQEQLRGALELLHQKLCLNEQITDHPL
jgi:DNA-binding MarR family transcriptional regulator